VAALAPAAAMNLPAPTGFGPLAIPDWFVGLALWAIVVLAAVVALLRAGLDPSHRKGNR
jgi:hypothetical protein